MKLKKIASLALAGIMAVSMLAACGEGTGSSSSNSDSNVVTPVDNSLATYINGELDDTQKAVITFSSDATVQAALEKVSATIPSDDLSATSNTTIAWYKKSASTAFQEAVEATTTNVIGEAFTSNPTDDVTAAGILIIPAFNGDEAMKKEVLEVVEGFVTEAKMPSADTSDDYRYTYAGKVAVTKVTSNDDKNVAYVVGIVVDMTATELA